MTNNQEELFERLEKLNAQIDIWIDDEEYDNIWGDTKGIITLSNNAKSKVRKCFPDDNGHCTHDKDIEWREALSFAKDTLPVAKVDANDLKEHKKDAIVQAWSHLFYAKLLRAKIQQRGSSDCYIRRLDYVAAYLERHLLQQNGQDGWVTRLTLMYLMELSATSSDWESLGFSERARRVIIDRKHPIETKSQKAPYEFYELWARYNIGVAYFHQAYYRRAVLEFNKVIWQVENWKKRTENWRYFDRNHGIELLYLPAILCRAEVQLKLQFAYHSLDTLDKRFWQNKGGKISVKKWRTRQKEIRADIIKAQAYQQMGRLDRSWDVLSGGKNSQVEEKRKGICELVTDGFHLGQREECNIPRPEKLKSLFPNLGERFLDILIADHLEWLTLEGEDSEQPPLELGDLVKRGDAKPDRYIRAVDKAKSYLDMLVKQAFSYYFEVAEYHAYNRRGYFQQLARYLAWLAKASDFKYFDPDFALSQDVKNARKKIALIAKQLYKKAKKEELLFEEDGVGKSKKGCRYCQAKGIDLRRIESEHYTWFTKAMLDFFNSKNIFGPGEIDKDKEKFIKRLMKLEWKERDDLRIRDLELRYEFYENKESFEKLLTDEYKKQQQRFSPDANFFKWLCWKEFRPEDIKSFAGLLKCAQGNKWNQENYASTDHLTSDDYIKIMKGWDEYYLRHLQSPSTHENHQKGGFYFMGLQRWNSASPAKGYSVGGGYLLYHLNEKNNEVDMGIAIDPGFDFVRNLFHMGFSLNDIDIVLISHAHLDHIRDFESIVMLLSELKKRSQRQKRVHVILSLGAYKRLEHIVEDPGFRYFVEPYIIDMDREISDDYFEDKKKMPEFKFELVNSNGEHGSSNYMDRVRAVLPGDEEQANNSLQVMITPTRAYHDDKTRSDSFGFLINMTERVEEQDEEEKQSNLIFGYTGDTKWVYPDMPDPLSKKSENQGKREGRKIKDIAEQYKKCNVLLIHLGSLIGKNDDDELSFAQYDQCSDNVDNKYKCEELVRKKDHPYLIGILRLLSSLYDDLSREGPNGGHKGNPLILVGEFGEELRGTIRIDLVQRLQEIYEEKLDFLPVDVGMNVYLRDKADKRPDNSHNDRCACKVWCVQCNHFVNIGDAEFELYGTDHALYCVCKTCRKATPINVLQDRLRQLYEVGLELRNNDNK